MAAARNEINQMLLVSIDSRFTTSSQADVDNRQSRWACSGRFLP
jgi:hypothetical protein